MVKFLTCVVILFAAISAFLFGYQKNNGKIQHLENELHKMRDLKDSLNLEVHFRDLIQEKLKSEILKKDSQADDLR
jgi:hypothetical protein